MAELGPAKIVFQSRERRLGVLRVGGFQGAAELLAGEAKNDTEATITLL